MVELIDSVLHSNVKKFSALARAMRFWVDIEFDKNYNNSLKLA